MGINKEIFNKKRIIAYVIISFAISWLIWLPNILARHFGIGTQNEWLHLLGGLGPFLSAIITTAIFGSWKGTKTFLKERYFSNPGIKWILLGVGMPLAFFLIAILGAGIFTGEWVHLSDVGLNAKLATESPLFVWFIWCIFFGIGEESGWRGFLFPEFTKKYQARIATFYTAIIWALWHIPLFFYDKDLSSMGFGTIGWLIGLICGSLLLGWLVKQSNWNLWPVILWHGTFNFVVAGDRISFLFPSIVSSFVIIAALWIARKYGSDLDYLKKKNEIHT